MDEELEVNLVNTLPISENKLELIKYEMQQDSSLKQIVMTGWPGKIHECPPAMNGTVVPLMTTSCFGVNEL